MPRVNIGMPVYNGEQYIRQAIDSFLQQTYTDFELIICDNASTDATPEICGELAARDIRIRYYRNARNRGAAFNYNRTFALATGEYFKWAAHDDICAPEYVERCVKVLDANPGVVLCYPRARIIDESGAYLHDYDDGFHLMSSRPSERLWECFLAGSWIFHPIFGLIRRETLKTTPLIGDYNGADFVLLAYLALAGQCYEIPERLFFRREHSNRCCKVPLDEMEQWWNTDKRSRFSFRHWRRLCEYIRASIGPQVPWSEKWRCIVHVLKWAYWHRSHLGADLRIAAKTVRWLLRRHHVQPVSRV
jgi:glycosyltransferase involved in cell wall biosynthesis